MGRLVIYGGQNGAREIHLQPGVNRVGRNAQNDQPINDPSVSSFHCEIDFRDGVITVRDLGSTNGTFINSVPVRQAIVEPGQTLRLGSVEMVYHTDAAQTASVSSVPLAISGIRVAKAHVETPAPTQPQVVGPPPIAAGGPDDCAYHPGTRAALVCQQCGLLFCKSCVKSLRAGARDVHSCPACRGICVNLDQHRQALAKEHATFASLLSGAFKYPLKQNGPMILICGTIFFGFLDLAKLVLGSFKMFGWLGMAYWLTIIMSVGYLFAFMQNIIVSSSQGEDNVPGWPEVSGFWDDMVVPFFRFITISAVCVGPGIAAMISVSVGLGIPILLLGLFCLPMALLTVSLAGGIGGLNPLIIFSSITKIPGPYLIACVVLLLVVGLETVCEAMVSFSAIYIIPTLIAKFISLYGLTVEMRILGLLYYTNKDKLSWFH